MWGKVSYLRKQHNDRKHRPLVLQKMESSIGRVSISLFSEVLTLKMKMIRAFDLHFDGKTLKRFIYPFLTLHKDLT